MDHFAGLDVSVKATSVCIVDDTGKVVREVKVASEPEALLLVLKSPAYRFKRIGWSLLLKFFSLLLPVPARRSIQSDKAKGALRRPFVRC